jgi:uncharacterized membrane protein YidH (DUF202 family)
MTENPYQAPQERGVKENPKPVQLWLRTFLMWIGIGALLGAGLGMVTFLRVAYADLARNQVPLYRTLIGAAVFIAVFGGMGAAIGTAAGVLLQAMRRRRMPGMDVGDKSP